MNAELFFVREHRAQLALLLFALLVFLLSALAGHAASANFTT